MRLARELAPGDAGGRVVVRRRLPDGAAGDVLGELLGWHGGVLRVQCRDGAVVEVAEADVLATKRVPPPPAPRPRRT